jgi:hypothetical protein
MNKVKLDILKRGGDIYYSDTDSIITNIPLDDSFVGNEIGQFKLEYELKQAYFICNKTYLFITNDNKTIIKSKGLDRKSLNIESFKSLLLGNDLNDIIRYETKKDFNEGHATLFVPKSIITMF